MDPTLEATADADRATEAGDVPPPRIGLRAALSVLLALGGVFGGLRAVGLERFSLVLAVAALVFVAQIALTHLAWSFARRR